MWPTAEERVLLRAAIHGGGPSAPIWDELRRNFPSGTSITARYARLAPLLWFRLKEAGIAWPEADTMKALYTFTWAANQLRITRGTEAAAALADDGIENLFLKGIAVLGMYPVLGTRPMTDIDILVHERDFTAALGVVRSLGWKQSFNYTSAMQRFGHAGLMTDNAGHELDLHWRLAPDVIAAPKIDEFWNLSSYRDFDSRRFRVPDPAFQLFHCMSHGLRWSRSPSLQWVADAGFIYKAAATSLDWDRLIDLADIVGRGTVIRQGLQFLVAELDAKVPEEALRPRPSIPRLERREAWFLSHVGPESKLGGLPDRWYLYRRVSDRLHDVAGPRGFWRYLRWRWAPHGGLLRTLYFKLAERVAGRGPKGRRD